MPDTVTGEIVIPTVWPGAPGGISNPPCPLKVCPETIKGIIHVNTGSIPFR